jgi:hypothetical protein
MAQLTFTIADGILTVGSANTTADYLSADYRAKAYRNGDRDGVKVYPINGNPDFPTWTCDDYQNFAVNINGTPLSPASAYFFVWYFNRACGTSLGYNTQYCQHILSFAMTLDTSVPEQITDIAKAGYMTIQADEDNAGVVYIGGDDVSDQSSYIVAGESKFVELDDLSKYWAYAEVADCIINVLGGYKY